MNKVEWQINGDSLLLFLYYTKDSESGGMSGGCSTVIASDKIKPDIDIVNQKRLLWKKATKNYNIGEYIEC